MASDIKEQNRSLLGTLTPYSSGTNSAELYDDSREDQYEDFETFSIVSQNIINNDVYENYKSYFYRYQDYNQINR